jgi:RNA-directed DNA polymerase
MTHGREKSDSAIVAEKPANKAGADTATATELVEPRAGTKRNAEQQSTHRTQGRERVSQALARVRKAARQRKKEKLTTLLHHVGIDLLREAFFALKRDAAPGVDQLTWKTYAADVEVNLTDLHARVQRGAYRHCRRAAHTFPRPMANNARWRWRLSRTRSSRRQPSGC